MTRVLYEREREREWYRCVARSARCARMERVARRQGCARMRYIDREREKVFLKEVS